MGGGFEHFILINSLVCKERCSYVFLRIEGDSYNRLVKILRIRNPRKGEKLRRARFVREASVREVRQMMENMVKGFLWERNFNVKVSRSQLDVERGILTVEYVADKPISDIRGLGASVAQFLHLRVEFVFIPRQKYAAKVGWLGRCGLELCCHVWLKNPPSITQDMARRQYLFAAPDKLTGACGRLLCCLAYEMPFYESMATKVPKLNSIINTDRGKAKVVEVNVVAGYYVLKYEDGKKEKRTIEGTP
ncbi:MAG: hypothetical protein GXO39_01445 [Thermotogae bacterium]|nr:hypothetical protein [Thermotogota bacterium]